MSKIVPTPIRQGKTNRVPLIIATPSGQLDTTFASGGIAITDFGYEDDAVAVCFAGNGDIIAAGSSNKEDYYGEDFALAEYRP